MLSAVLGKLLESMVGVRLGRLGMSKKWFGPGHAGGILHRDTTGLLQATSHGLRKRPTSTILTTNIKGDYNATKLKPAIAATEQLGVPVQLRKWTEALMTNRHIYVPEGLP